MPTGLGTITALATPAMTAGQIGLINYIHTLGRIDPAPFARDAFDPENMTVRGLRALREGRMHPCDGYFRAAASVVTRAVRYEKTLHEILGRHWRSEPRFELAVCRELAAFRSAIGPAHEELKAWREALGGFRFDELDASDAFDIREEPALRAPLEGLQAVFLEKIQRAHESLEVYGSHSPLGVEDYFQVSPRRRSGIVPAPRAEELPTFI